MQNKAGSLSGTVKRACVFAHYDSANVLDPYVRYYLGSLCQVIDCVVLVTVSALDPKVHTELAALGVRVIARSNEGYDFCSYKLGLASIELSNFDEVVLCNDSVYGPFVELHELFDRMTELQCDFWGVSDSYEIAHHIQSYFMVFRRTVIESYAYTSFWQSVQPLNDKAEVIRKYEVGLSQQLIAAGFTPSSLVVSSKRSVVTRIARSPRQFLYRYAKRWRKPELYKHLFLSLIGRQAFQVNPMQLEWRDSLRRQLSPFIKVELLRDDPLGIAAREEILEEIGSNTSYPLALIRNHLQRVCDTY